MGMFSVFEKAADAVKSAKQITKDVKSPEVEIKTVSEVRKEIGNEKATNNLIKEAVKGRTEKPKFEQIGDFMQKSKPGANKVTAFAQSKNETTSFITSNAFSTADRYLALNSESTAKKSSADLFLESLNQKYSSNLTDHHYKTKTESVLAKRYQTDDISDDTKYMLASLESSSKGKDPFSSWATGLNL